MEYYSAIKRDELLITHNMDKLQKECARQKKLVTKDYILYDSI